MNLKSPLYAHGAGADTIDTTDEDETAHYRHRRANSLLQSFYSMGKKEEQK